MSKEKKLTKIIIVFNIILLIVTAIMQRTESNVYAAKRNAENLDTLRIKELKVGINEYKDELSKELFNFQLIALVKESGHNSGLVDLYNNEIDNMEISPNEIKKLLKKDFTEDLESAFDKIDKFIKEHKGKEEEDFIIENGYSYDKYDVATIYDLQDALEALEKVSRYITKDDYKKAKDYIIKDDVISKLVKAKVLRNDSTDRANTIINAL